MIELLGWASSAMLLATLIKQVHKQWTSRTSEGLSKWLFVGQLGASVGFTIYSFMTGSIVFGVTNAILTVNSVVGIILYYKFLDSKD